jgi:hypothetical protein
MNLTSDYRKRPPSIPSGDLILRDEKLDRLRRMAQGLRDDINRNGASYDPVVRDDALMRADRWDREANEMALEGIEP